MICGAQIFKVCIVLVLNSVSYCFLIRENDASLLDSEMSQRSGHSVSMPIDRETHLTERANNQRITSSRNVDVSAQRSPSHPDTGRNGTVLRDLLVIVDSSGGIGRTYFNAVKTYLARLMGMFCPTPDPFNGYHQAALIEYSTNVKEIFDFNDKPNTLAVQEGIRSMRYTGGSTCTATAFNYAYETMFTTAKGMRTRPDVKQEVLIITDGKSNCGGNAIQAAKRLQKKADVFGLMIGTQSTTGKIELSNYVSLPLDQHLFAVTNYQNLKELVDLIEQQLNVIPCVPFDI